MVLRQIGWPAALGNSVQLFTRMVSSPPPPVLPHYPPLGCIIGDLLFDVEAAVAVREHAMYLMGVG